MSFNELDEEQKKRLLIGIVIGIAIIAATFWGIKFSLSSIAKAKLELDDLMTKIESADHSLSRQSQVRKELIETTEILKAYLLGAPPEKNYYSWASKVIYAKARQAEVDIDSIDEQTKKGATTLKGKGTATLKLKAYSLRITAHSSYKNLKLFLSLIEENHPMARVTTVNISQGKDPEIHDIQLIIQWPFNLSSVANTWDDVKLNNPISANPNKKSTVIEKTSREQG